MIDYGFDVYAQQTTVDEKGRRILIAWMALWESDMPEQKYNWAGAMTLPRILTWRDGQLFCEPVPELEKLKKEGEGGRKQINQYTRYLTVVLALFQSWGIGVGLQSSGTIVTTPGIFFVMTTAIMSSFQVFEQIYMLGGGSGYAGSKFGPNDAGRTMVPLIYDLGFEQFKMGRASAVAYILFLVILVFTMLQLRVLRQKTAD